MTAEVDLGRLLAETEALVSDLFGNISIVEQAVKQAQHDHPDLADVIEHADSLLLPTHPLMKTEFVYESHVRELLARVTDPKPWKRGAVGADTRPATWAELVCALHDVSLQVPLHGAGFAAYVTAWRNAFPDNPGPFGGFDDELAYLQRNYGDEVAGLHAGARRRGAQPWRLLEPGKVECPGRHHGEAAECRYAKPPTLFDEEAS